MKMGGLFGDPVLQHTASQLSLIALARKMHSRSVIKVAQALAAYTLALASRWLQPYKIAGGGARVLSYL
jgi:hypothetical protein